MNAAVTEAVGALEAEIETSFRLIGEWWKERPRSVVIDWDRSTKTFVTSVDRREFQEFVHLAPTRDIPRVREVQESFREARRTIHKRLERGRFDERREYLAGVLWAEGLLNPLTAQRVDLVEAFGWPEELACLEKLRYAWGIHEPELKDVFRCGRRASFPVHVELGADEDWAGYEAGLRFRVERYLERILTDAGRESIISDALEALDGVRIAGVLAFEDARFQTAARNLPFKRLLRKCWVRCGYDDLMFDLCTAHG